jgi:hypothetical protein
MVGDVPVDMGSVPPAPEDVGHSDVQPAPVLGRQAVRNFSGQLYHVGFGFEQPVSEPSATQGFGYPSWR